MSIILALLNKYAHKKDGKFGIKRNILEKPKLVDILSFNKIYWLIVVGIGFS